MVSIRSFTTISLTRDNLRYGTQLAASVAVAYLIPWALSLPEGFWAVMSALIIMRSRTGSTLEEGWGRFKGALAGTLFGLFGVWMHSLGLVTSVTTLAVIAVLAFIAGLAPALRAAPITALIILSSGTIPGHGPWQVAGLRILEISIGIASGLLVTWLTPASRSPAHFEESVAKLLKDVGEQTARDLRGEALKGEAKDEAAREMRTRIGRLILLGASADTEHRFSLKKKVDKPEVRVHERQARLISRIVQDAALFGRVHEAMPDQQGTALWSQVAQQIAGALNGVAEEGGKSGRTALRELELCMNKLEDEPDAAQAVRLLAAPVNLFTADIKLLLRLRQRA